MLGFIFILESCLGHQTATLVIAFGKMNVKTTTDNTPHGYSAAIDQKVIETRMKDSFLNPMIMYTTLTKVMETQFKLYHDNSIIIWKIIDYLPIMTVLYQMIQVYLKYLMIIF